MSDLERRIARLEAVEAVRGVFVSYTQFMDAGLVPELVQLFTADGEFLAENEPGGTGGTVSKVGHEQIETHFRPLPFGWFRHHTTNTSIDVAPDASSAELSSYFLTSFPQGVQGGLYEGTFVPAGDGSWRIRRLQVTSSWGWVSGQTDGGYFVPLPERTLRGGRPVIWDETIGQIAGEGM